jgi:hypothetical protein
MVIILINLLVVAIFTIKFMSGAHSHEYLLTDCLFGLLVNFLYFDLVVGIDGDVLIPHLLNRPVLAADYLLIRGVPDAVGPAGVLWVEGVAGF